MAQTAANCSDMSPEPIEKVEGSLVLASNLPSEPIRGGLVAPLEDQEGMPSFMKIIGELHSLFNVMQTFHCRWDELQKHFDFIGNAIESREKELINLLPTNEPQDNGKIITEKDSETTSLNAKEITGTDLPCLENQESEKETPTPLVSGKPSESYVENLCRNMSSRELRRHISTHLHETSKLRQEVPGALKSAPNPAKLVLQCVGRFFVQGSIAFTKNSTMIPSRKAALLVMEYFLLMGGCTKIEESVKEEAEEASLAWMKRLVAEGGVSVAANDDARGLLLFVACFGIPDAFTTEDLIQLLRMSSAREISEALRKSSFLTARMTDIIECMKKKGMHIGAVDTICTFGIDDKFPLPTIVGSFLRDLKESIKKATSEGHGSSFPLIVAKEKQLDALNSLRNCLDAHKIKPYMIFKGWNLRDKIVKVEKEIAELKSKIESKRKAEEQSFEIPNDQEFKRSRMIPEASVQIPFDSHVSRYYDSVNPTASSWPHDYAVGMSSRVSLPGPSFGPSIPSGPSLGPSAGSPFGLHERSVERNMARPVELGTRVYVGSSSLIEGFPGVPSRSSASDLYNFADGVLEEDFARGSYRSGATPRTPSSYRSSFL